MVVNNLDLIRYLIDGNYQTKNTDFHDLLTAMSCYSCWQFIVSPCVPLHSAPHGLADRVPHTCCEAVTC